MRIDGVSECGYLYGTNSKHTKKLPKKAKHYNLLKTIKILNTEIQTKWCPVFIFSKAGGSHP